MRKDRHFIFSIICPVYNASNYIKFAIESVLQQDYAYWELILIDDGSTDGSDIICHDYAKKDKRIKVICEKNLGVAAARNAGMRLASGDWILFLDSDDYFEKNALSILNNNIDEEIEMIIFNHYVDIENKSYKHIIESVKNIRYDKKFIENQILPGMLNTCDLREENQIDILPFVWNKAYKREVLLKHEIMFCEKLRMWEDKIFWILYMKYISSILFIDDGIYHYVQAKKERLSGKFIPEIFQYVVTIYNIMKQNFGDSYDIDSPYSNRHYYRVIQNLIEQAVERNGYKDFCVIIRENLSIPQIEKGLLNVPFPSSPKMSEDIRNRNYNSIAKKTLFTNKGKKRNKSDY